MLKLIIQILILLLRMESLKNFPSGFDRKNTKMIEIDGTFGEGGGQILRTSLSLAAITGQAAHIVNIRAKRTKPGLMRQHLACVTAVTEITGGHVSGAELNSRELTFEPGTIHGGDFHFAVGSAGSVTLIAQTVIPALLCADVPSHVVIEGGTHTDQAPIFEFFDRVYLPALRKMGAEITAKMESIGFYPAGGGKIVLDIQPVKTWNRFECMQTGKLNRSLLIVMGCDIDRQIMADEVFICKDHLEVKEGFQHETQNVKSPGPGNVLYAQMEYENITELFSVCGEFNVSRREVGKRVAGMVNKYLMLNVPVWRFLADQLLLPMAIGAGGKYLTAPPSKHTQTNIEVIRKFLNTDIELENRKNETYVIEVKK